MAKARRSGSPPVEPYVPPHIDAAVEHARADSRTDLVPWAWYSLGWHGKTMPVWVSLAEGGRNIGGEEVFRAIPAAAYSVHTAVDVLANRVPTRTATRLKSCCDRLVLHNDDLSRVRFGLPARHGLLFDTGGDANRELQAAVEDLSSALGDEAHWLEFGRRLGTLYAREHFSDTPLIDAFREVLCTCSALPRRLATAAPLIREMAHLPTPVHENVGQVGAEFRRLCDPDREPDDDARLGFSAVSLHVGVFKFACEIRSALLGKRRTPAWVKTPNGGELRFDGVVVRRVTGLKRSSNMVRVLDAFEEDGWPPRIDSPLLKSDSQTLHNTLHQLRDGLLAITFEADGTGEGICWVDLSSQI